MFLVQANDHSMRISFVDRPKEPQPAEFGPEGSWNIFLCGDEELVDEREGRIGDECCDQVSGELL